MSMASELSVRVANPTASVGVNVRTSVRAVPPPRKSVLYSRITRVEVPAPVPLTRQEIELRTPASAGLLAFAANRGRHGMRKNAFGPPPTVMWTYGGDAPSSIV